MVATVTAQYYKWLSASPLDRLQIAAPDPSTIQLPTDSEWNFELQAIILAALPGSLKDEAVASRQLATGELLYKILRVYQPGGVQERAETLSALTGDQAAKSAKDAVDKLRRWRRYQLRAMELQASLPDPSLMIRSLSRLVDAMLNQAPQALFRVNAYRMQSKLDVMPSEANLEAYYNLLLADQTRAPRWCSNPTPVQPKRTNQGTGQGTKRYAATGEPQDNAQITRCSQTRRTDAGYACSSTEHIKSACPYKAQSIPGVVVAAHRVGPSERFDKDRGEGGVEPWSLPDDSQWTAVEGLHGPGLPMCRVWWRQKTDGRGGRHVYPKTGG